MKLFQLLLLMLIASTGRAQGRWIEGHVYVEKGTTPVYVVLNDTVSKLGKQSDTYFERLHALTAEQRYVCQADGAGYFRIRAGKKDSLVFVSEGHYPKRVAVADLPPRRNLVVALWQDTTKYSRPCYDAFPEPFVFVGKKISIDPVERKYGRGEIPFWFEFACKMTLQQLVSGRTLPDTVLFSAFVHSRPLRFLNDEQSLFFVTKHCNRLYHARSFLVCTDPAGRYVVPFQPGMLPDSNDIRKPTWLILPELIPLHTPRGLTDEDYEYYPKPYFEIREGRAYTRYGYYLPEFLELLKRKNAD